MPFLSALISGGIIFGLAFWLWRSTAAGNFLKVAFWLALTFRVLCGFALGYIYWNEAINGGDTVVFQKIGNLLTSVGEADFQAYLNILLFNEFTDPQVESMVPYPTYTNSFFLIKVVSLLNFITAGNYYLNSLFFSFFSFAGCWCLALKLGRYFPGALKAALIGLLLFPSVVFWNSGVMKDGVMLGALSFLWAAALTLAYDPSCKKILQVGLILLMGLLLWKIKFFVAAFVFALTGSWFCLHWLSQRHRFFRQGYGRWLAIPALIGLIVFGFSLLHYKFNLPFLLMSLVLNNQLFQAGTLGKPSIDLSGLEPNLSSILLYTPEAIGGTLFRPFFWEGNTVFYLLAGLENAGLLVLTLGTLLGLRKFNFKKYPGFYLMLIIYTCCLAAAFGLSTPNLGSLNRYRTAFLPFLVFLLLETPFWQKVLSRAAVKFKAWKR